MGDSDIFCGVFHYHHHRDIPAREKDKGHNETDPVEDGKWRCDC